MGTDSGTFLSVFRGERVANPFARRVLEAVLWILNNNHMLPQCYLQDRARHEVLRDPGGCGKLRERGGLESESFIDAMFSSAKGGGAEVGPTKRGKGVKIMGIVDREGLPLSVSTHAANIMKFGAVELRVLHDRRRSTGDKAYGDPLDAEREGVEMIAPHRKNRKRRKTQDGRALTSLRAAVEGRALFCLAPMAAPYCDSLGVLSEQLPGLCAARIPADIV